jgi:hypothetical protein
MKVDIIEIIKEYQNKSLRKSINKKTKEIIQSVK